jgi:hypothetical protein
VIIIYFGTDLYLDGFVASILGNISDTIIARSTDLNREFGELGAQVYIQLLFDGLELWSCIYMQEIKITIHRKSRQIIQKIQCGSSFETKHIAIFARIQCA